MRVASSARGLIAYCAFFCGFFAILILTHAPVLNLPYFWDELGQFVPAALDIAQHNAWVPKSTLPNVHPPGVMAYLAGIWKLFGYSVMTTRLAMLAFAALGVLAVFSLAVELGRPLNGFPAFIAAALLLADPLFWSQSMMVQLDMPAMVLTAASMVLFLRGRYVLCAGATTLLVLCKETSIVVPAVFGAVLLWERRFLSAICFFAPAVALAVWLAYLHSMTGHIFGNPEFTHYNIAFQLHPVRLPLTVLRRIFYIFIDNFHWIGTIALFLAWKRTTLFRTRAWAIVGLVFLFQTLAVTVLGGAALERYLMPVLPFFYVAVASAWTMLPRMQARLSLAFSVAGLVLMLFVNSPFPYAYENNAAFVDFVRLQQRAAEYVEDRYPSSTITSAWPFPDALRRLEFGYVTRRISAQGIPNFDPATVRALTGKVEILVLYSRTWEPPWSVIRLPPVRRFLEKYYFYVPQISAEEIQNQLGLSPVARWERHGQWIEMAVFSLAARM